MDEKLRELNFLENLTYLIGGRIDTLKREIAEFEKAHDTSKVLEYNPVGNFLKDYKTMTKISYDVEKDFKK